MPLVDYEGPPIDEPAVLERLPEEYAALLGAQNGCVLFDGGLHIRGVCHEPLWHSLQHVWTGDLALHRLYSCISDEDVPFAQEAAGDQFILRDDRVFRLGAGDDELSEVGAGFDEFMKRAAADPVEFIGMHPLIRFSREGRALAPGEGLFVYPPFIFAESANGVMLESIDSLELIGAYADLARQIRDLPSGTRVKVEVEPRRRRWRLRKQ